MTPDQAQAAVGTLVEVYPDNGPAFRATVDELDPAYPDRDVVWVRVPGDPCRWPMRPDQLRDLGFSIIDSCWCGPQPDKARPHRCGGRGCERRLTSSTATTGTERGAR